MNLTLRTILFASIYFFEILLAPGLAHAATWQLVSSDISDVSCPATDSNNIYSALPNCPAGTTTGASCPNGTPTSCKINTVSSYGGSGGCYVYTDVYHCDGSDGISCTTTPGSCTETGSSWVETTNYVYSGTLAGTWGPQSTSCVSSCEASGTRNCNEKVYRYNFLNNVNYTCYAYNSPTGGGSVAPKTTFQSGEPNTRTIWNAYSIQPTYSCTAPVTTCSASACTTPWGTTVASGSSVTAYQSSSVTYPSSCQSQTRTCTNGSLSGSYTNKSCAVNYPAPTSYPTISPDPTPSGTAPAVTLHSTNANYCYVAVDWNVIAAGYFNSGTYNGPSNLSSGTHQAETYCYNVVWQGSGWSGTNFTVANAPVAGACGTANGRTYAYGSTSYNPYTQCSIGSPSTTAFPSAGNTQFWTCSGAYGGANASCSASQTAPPASCALPWGGSITSGSSVTAYQSSSVTYPAACVSQTRTCTDGTLSGSWSNESCAVNYRAPTVTATVNGASSASITTAETFDLKMASSNATSCRWTRTGSYSGNWTNQPVPAPGTSYDSGIQQWGVGNATWTFTCANAAGTSVSQSASVTITNAPVAGACGTANGRTYAYGSTSYNPYTQCSIGSPSTTAFPSAGNTQFWTCSGAYGGANASCSASQTAPASCSATTIGNCNLSATVSGNSSGSCASGYSGSCNYSCSNSTWTKNTNTCAPIPTASLRADPTQVDVGQSSTLSWRSTDATSCTGTGFAAGAPYGNRSTGTLNSAGTQTYQVICSGAGGTSAPSFASVEVLAPNVTITAEPARVKSGGSVTLSWSGSGVKRCTVSGPGVSSSGNADRTNSFSTGSPQTITVSGQSVYTVSCTTNGSPISKSITVNILPNFTEF